MADRDAGFAELMSSFASLTQLEEKIDVVIKSSKVPTLETIKLVKASNQIEAGAYIASSPALADGQVYVGNYEDTFLCRDIVTGRVVWDYKNQSDYSHCHHEFRHFVYLLSLKLCDFVF